MLLFFSNCNFIIGEVYMIKQTKNKEPGNSPMLQVRVTPEVVKLHF